MMSLLKDADPDGKMPQQVPRVAQDADINGQTPRQKLPVAQDANAYGQMSQQNMEPIKIKSENADNADERPLKKTKTSELMDSELDKDLNENSRSPTSTSNQTDLDIVQQMPSAASPNIEKLSSDFEMIDSDTYDYLPQDYTLTDVDLCAQIIIETSLKDEVLVKIDEISVKQHQLSCLC